MRIASQVALRQYGMLHWVANIADKAVANIVEGVSEAGSTGEDLKRLSDRIDLKIVSPES